jgi:type VI protein secretion system component VasF
MADDQSSRAALPSRRRHLRRWLPLAVIALLLLAASQALWYWQSWPVRHLLGDGP